MSFIPQFNEGPYSQLSSPAQTLGFPDVLTFRDSWTLLNEHSNSTKILLGVDGEGFPITVDLDSDSPHVLVSASTGGGKSVILRSATAQILANGGVATVLDLKRHSHRWAKNLHNVGYAQTLGEIGNALVEIGKEVHRRNKIVEDWPGSIETAPVGPRIVVVFEEMNATMSQLRELTRRIPAGTYDAIDAFRDILFMGRAAKVHILAVAQFADARTMGGSDIRENFTTRILLNYSKQAWTMLAYDCGIPQAAPEHVGRGMVCRGGKARQTQFLYLTEEEAAAMARGAYAAVQDRSLRRIGA
jgi:DNA segregation ATPase FtsK/SpoIIIE-like protein